MTYRKWLVGAVVLGVGVTAANRGCLHRKAPDEKLADHLAQTCRIARDNVDTPKRGVDELGRYLAKHTGEVMGDFGDLLTTIETIRDDREHDERALLASDRLREVTRPCRQTWLDFNDAVMADPDAAASLDRSVGRLARTLQILIDGSLGQQVATPMDLRTLPGEIDRALDTLTTRR
jgi:hypothetical protein